MMWTVIFTRTITLSLAKVQKYSEEGLVSFVDLEIEVFGHSLILSCTYLFRMIEVLLTIVHRLLLWVFRCWLLFTLMLAHLPLQGHRHRCVAQLDHIL